MLDDLNKAKALAWKHAAAAVEVLAKIMVDTDLYDTEVRVQAAAELLQFAAKGPICHRSALRTQNVVIAAAQPVEARDQARLVGDKATPERLHVARPQVRVVALEEGAGAIAKPRRPVKTKAVRREFLF